MPDPRGSGRGAFPRWPEVDRLFAQALERPAGERRDFLSAACAEDAELRSAVERLLAASEEEDSRLEPGAAAGGPLGHGLMADLAAEDGAASHATSEARRLAPGRLLGRYRIVGPLGRGGMGEVYRAHDTRLDREVALKLLPRDLAGHETTRRRLEREARTVAGLSHPNICALYDLERLQSDDADGGLDELDVLVMEHLDGETLAQRLARGRLPLDEVLRLAIEIASGLEEAHRHQVIHRDLKPSNVMLVGNGPRQTTKILDFGIAKTVLARGASAASAATPPQPLTQEGRILGTVPYMSPEQVEGKELDERSDLFSFGAVLYEMVTGRRAFPGESQGSVAAAILERDTEPMVELAPATPPALEHLVQRCLSKDPGERWQTAIDVRRELEWIADGGGGGGVPPKTVRRLARRNRLLVGGVGVALLVGAVLGALLVRARPGDPPRTSRPPVRLTITPPDEEARIYGLAFSPDGTRLAWASVGRSSGLWLRRLDELEATEIAGTWGAISPSFSPDGEWISFIAEGMLGMLKKVPVAGGPVVSLTEARQTASWSSDGTIVFNNRSGGVSQIAASGGEPTVLLNVAAASRARTAHSWPQLLPGSQAVLYADQVGGQSAIFVYDLETGERRLLVEGGRSPRYSPSGHLLYFSPGGTAASLWAVAFDPSRLELKGPAVPVIDSVWVGLGGTAPGLALSQTGALAYVPSPEAYTLVWVDHEGRTRPVTERRARYRNPRLSPDGQRVAVLIEDVSRAVTDLFLLDLERDTMTKLADEAGGHLWAPDGERLIFRSAREGGPPDLYSMEVSGRGEGKRAIHSAPRLRKGLSPQALSPDGRHLALVEDRVGGADILVLDLASEGEPRPFVTARGAQNGPAFSPDGKWIAYASSETGPLEVYAKPFPGPGPRILISRDGGVGPLWAPDGKRIYYFLGNLLMSVPVTYEPELRPGKPEVLFEGRFKGTNWWFAGFDITADGEHFLMVQEEATPITVVLDWFDELERLVPTTGE